MDYRRFENTIVARFDRGEEITAQLRALCEKENIRLASVEALGATDEFTVGVYNVDEKQYHALTFTGAHEIVSLTGTVNTMNGEYYSHLHMSAANESGAVVGGHLNAARVKRLKYSRAASIRVCCSMISETHTRYGVGSSRQGRGRASFLYQSTSGREKFSISCPFRFFRYYT